MTEFAKAHRPSPAIKRSLASRCPIESAREYSPEFDRAAGRDAGRRIRCAYSLALTLLPVAAGSLALSREVADDSQDPHWCLGDPLSHGRGFYLQLSVPGTVQGRRQRRLLLRSQRRRSEPVHALGTGRGGRGTAYKSRFCHRQQARTVSTIAVEYRTVRFRAVGASP